MTRHLLDSDGIIDALKGVDETLALFQRLAQRGDILCANDVVFAEIHAGLHAHDEARAERFLGTLEYLPTSADAARQAGRWRYLYARQGQTLSLTDCLIAATAYEHGANLVTGNTKDFPMPEITTVALPRSGRGGRASRR